MVYWKKHILYSKVDLNKISNYPPSCLVLIVGFTYSKITGKRTLNGRLSK